MASPSTLQPEKNRESVEQSSSPPFPFRIRHVLFKHKAAINSLLSAAPPATDAATLQTSSAPHIRHVLPDHHALINSYLSAGPPATDAATSQTPPAPVFQPSPLQPPASQAAITASGAAPSFLSAVTPATDAATLQTPSAPVPQPSRLQPLAVASSASLHAGAAPASAPQHRPSAPLQSSSATSNSVSDAPPKPLVNVTKVSIISEDEEENEEEEQEEEEEDDYISEGNMSDASSTIVSEGMSIEGHFNVRVHNTLPEYSCGFFSLLEAAKCLTASYSLELPDDAVSLRKAIVDFIRTNLDTCCEGGGSGRTWREEIALKYFSETQYLPSPQSNLLSLYRTDFEGEIFVKSINDYLEAMANPLILIDELALMAFARIWDVRVVMFCRKNEGWTSDGTQYLPAIKYLDEAKSIYLVLSGQRFEWAHADGYNCGVESCRESGKRISAHHEFFNYPCDDKSLLPSVTALTVAAEANVLSEACRQLNFAQTQLQKTHDDMQVSHQARKSKKHVALAVEKQKVAFLRKVCERAKFEFEKLINTARGIQSVYALQVSHASSSTDVTEDAIRILLALDSGLHLTSLQMEELYDKLRSRGSILAKMYRENDYELMISETIHLLKQYSGRQILDDRDLTVFHDDLKAHGWVLSPRMWTREEIAVMCIILLDPKLLFNSILQKNGKEDENRQNRGMACLDSRVQAIMYSRLKQYKFVLEDKHLPMDVPAAVVLNSGGSYQQMGTWEYSKKDRFVVDNTVDAMLFEVIGAPVYTYCDGLYIATKTRRPNGEPVYVGISPTQFHGLSTTKPQIWDAKPMAKALSPNHVLHEYFTKGASDGDKYKTERVMYWENGKAVFQSVTAYGTDMKLLTMDCETLLHPVFEWSRIYNFDFKNKKSMMVSGSKKKIPQLSRVEVRGTIAPDYTFGCGTERIEVPIKKFVSISRPKPLQKQCLHKDGPTLYDGKQFDCHGNILPNARGDTTRTIPLPPCISLSALFAFFCRTFLGIKAVQRKNLERSCSSGSLRLHARIGRAIIFAFDTDHQVWRYERCMTCVHVRV
jgi:hypothetical protein